MTKALFFYHATEKKFEKMCQSIIEVQGFLCQKVAAIHALKESKPKMVNLHWIAVDWNFIIPFYIFFQYFLVMLTMFSVLAWLGNLVNNLFLTYVFGKCYQIFLQSSLIKKINIIPFKFYPIQFCLSSWHLESNGIESPKNTPRNFSWRSPTSSVTFNMKSWNAIKLRSHTSLRSLFYLQCESCRSAQHLHRFYTVLWYQLSEKTVILLLLVVSCMIVYKKRIQSWSFGNLS